MKKKIFVLTLTLLMTLNLAACASKKEEKRLPDIPEPGSSVTQMEVSQASTEVETYDATEAPVESARVDLNYNGGCEFPEEVTVGHCDDCDEQYANTTITEELIPMSELDTNTYVTYFGYHDMKINGHSFSDVDVYSSELDREHMKEYVIGEYEDDSVYIKLLKITDDGYYYGYLYDKTNPVRRATGAIEYPTIYAFCPADPITMEDMITALHAFNFTTVTEDDGNEHLHILPVIN